MQSCVRRTNRLSIFQSINKCYQEEIACKNCLDVWLTGIGKATNCRGPPRTISPPRKVFLRISRIDEQSLNIDSYFFHCAITLPSMNVFKGKLLNRLILRDKLCKKLCGYCPIKYANICVSKFRWSSGMLKVI